MKKHRWRLAILDEAQAIKNSGTKQTRAAKELTAGSRIAMTGTPVENRLSDLWSLFDFLNPGLLGTAKQFGAFVKQLQDAREPSFEPLRNLVRPYILRRLKTDKRVISDLPDKTEVKAYLPAEQAPGGPLPEGRRRPRRTVGDERRHPAPGDRPGPVDAAEADLQSPGPGDRHERLLRRAERQVPDGWRRSPRRSPPARKRSSSSPSSGRSPSRWPTSSPRCSAGPGWCSTAARASRSARSSSTSSSARTGRRSSSCR